METRTANIYPQNFRGVVSESADAWLRQFLNYCAYKGYDDHRTKALFRVLLVECAAVWFDSLEEAVQHDWTQLKAAFLARYTTPEFMKYKHATELFNSKQGERSVDDFCAYMQNLAREVKADEHMLCYAVLNGLKSEIKNHVTRLRPVTWKDLVDAAKVGEMCVPETPAIGSSVTVQLELIQDQLKELSAQRSPSSAPVDRPDDRPLRSPSPRRVRFDDRASDVRPRWTSPPGNSSFRGRGTFRGYRNNRFTSSPNQYWRNDNDQQQSVFGQQRGRARPYYRDNTPARSWPDGYDRQTCGRCGRRAHSHPNLCPAINLNCRGCGRKGHFLRVCRSSMQSQTSSY